MPTLVTSLRDGPLLLERAHPMHCDELNDAVRASLPELAVFAGWAHPGYTRDDAACWVSECWLDWRRGRAYQFVLGRVATKVGFQPEGRVRKALRIGDVDHDAVLYGLVSVHDIHDPEGA